MTERTTKKEKPVVLEARSIEYILRDELDRKRKEITDLRSALNARDEEIRVGMALNERLQENISGLVYGLTLAAQNGRSWCIKALELEAKLSKLSKPDTVALAE